MSLITEQSFEYRTPNWVTDPEVNEKDKRYLIKECGLGQEFATCDAMHLDSRCFNCGEVLATPYIYWHGHNKGISLHPECARHLAKGITQDADKAESPAIP